MKYCRNPNKSPKSESQLVENAQKRIQSNYKFIVSREVPLLGRYADLVFYDEKSLVSVEFKLNNWRRAIKQARDHKLSVDFSYICMPERHLTHKFESEIYAAGIGLIFFKEKGRWPFREVIDAPNSDETWQVARAKTLQYLKSSSKNFHV